MASLVPAASAGAFGVTADRRVGIVTVKAVKGGLDIPDEDGRDLAVIASATVEVKLELP